jgi:hypothetical protein
MNNTVYCLDCNRTVKATIASQCPYCDRQLKSQTRQVKKTKQANLEAFHEWAATLHAMLDAQSDSRSLNIVNEGLKHWR